MAEGTFKVGEIALLRNLPAPFDGMNGDECEIIAGLDKRIVKDIHGSFDLIDCYGISCRGVRGAVQVMNLKKKPAEPQTKDAEFGKKVEWSTCGWKPHDLVGA